MARILARLDKLEAAAGTAHDRCPACRRRIGLYVRQDDDASPVCCVACGAVLQPNSRGPFKVLRGVEESAL